MKPILFNADMVRAILEGRKTVTRRVIKNKDIINAWDCESDGTPIAFIDRETGDSHPPAFPCQYQPGDILYVRETWAKRASDRCNGVETGRCPFETCETAPGPCFSEEYIYKATDSLPTYGGKWHPSIHMPKEAARLFLRVTDVRAERLQDIFKDPPGPKNQVVREGFRYGCDFIATWQNTMLRKDWPVYGWDANPWVWVIEFERVSKEAALKGGESDA